MKLERKNILIISPQKWSDLMVSKHHYARELALKGNNVFFLNPYKQGKAVVEIMQHRDIQNLKIISYEFSLPVQLRFHLRWLFDLFMQRRVRRILKLIDGPIDVLWCFEPNLFSNLNWFKAKLKIYHIVDYLNQKHQLVPAKNADVVLGVADNILAFFKDINRPRYFVNHGLSSYYTNYSLDQYVPNQYLRVCYIGNLLIQGMDRIALRKIISKHQEIKFDFYGSYEYSNETDQEAIVFIEFLKSQPNVILHGVLNPKDLSVRLLRYDAFILCYKPEEELNFGSNSHKILEYLSTGRLIISSRVKAYEKNSDIIAMSKKNSNEDYVELFNFSIANIQNLNDIKLMRLRKDLALDNTYKKQIERIEVLIH